MLEKLTGRAVVFYGKKIMKYAVTVIVNFERGGSGAGGSEVGTFCAIFKISCFFLL